MSGVTQPRLPLPAEPETTGTCPRCRTVQRTWLYDAKAPAPWWYMVMHARPVGLGWCPGGGYPAIEQPRPDPATGGTP